MRDRDLIIEGARIDRERHWVAYTDLEEFHAGMWRPIHGDKRQTFLVAQSVSILRNSAKFRHALRRVIEEWPVSCKAEFTSPGNHLSWMGCAACCLIAGVPEDLTRRAWWKLTEMERAEANRLANNEIVTWREFNLKMQMILPRILEGIC